MKIAEEKMEDEEQIEAAPTLVTREIKNKRVAEEASLQKVDLLAQEMGVPAEQLLKDSTVEAAQIGIELTENLQQPVVLGDLLKDAEEVQMEGADEVQEENVDCSEAAASEATRGNPDSLHSTNVIEIEPSSASTSTSDSSDLDDVPLDKIYTSINKSRSPSTKLKKKPSVETYEPLYLFVLKRIGEMSQMRVNVCARLPVDHPIQPPMIECLQSIPADVEGVDEPVGSESANISTSSHPFQPPVIKPLNFAPAHEEIIGEQVGSKSANIDESSSPQPKSPTKSLEPSVLENLVNHYSGELPGVESNQ